jgi:(hydroxyamino)benzene mutase
MIDLKLRGKLQMQTDDRRLMWHGMFLFLLGLLTGFVEHSFTNVRMGLSAHLEGVMNGIFLVALGSIWSHVHLLQSVKTTAYWTALYGTYANWLVTSIAASFGTAANSPITSAGHSGKPWQESFIASGFLSVAIAIVTTSILVLWGLRARALQHSDTWLTAELSVSRVSEGRRS